MDYSIFDSEELTAFSKRDLNNGRLEEALFKVKLALAQPSAPNECHSIAGKVCAQLGLFNKAKTYYEQYLESSPLALVERFELGMTYYECGKMDGALSIWNAVLESEPHYPPALYFSGVAFTQLGDFKSSKSHLETLIATAPEDNLYFPKAAKLLKEINGSLDAGLENPRQYQ